jgi:CO/xanthine dehydrogenase Mo-binding subunit
VSERPEPARERAVVGTSPPRYEGVDKVTGRARYGPDVTLPGLLHGKVLRSPHAHARIRSIDTNRAEALPGVHAVVTAGDIPAVQELAADPGEGDEGLRRQCDATLAGDRVLYEGHPVAAVAATTPHLATQALRLIDVTYDVLPAVLDVVEAMDDTAPVLHETLRTESLAGEEQRPTNVAHHLQHAKGDPEEGFAAADVIVEREFRTATVHQGHLEPHAATALWRPDGGLTVYTTTQGSFAFRDHLAQLLCMPLSRIRVVPTEVGGAFGAKNNSYVDVVAALLSRRSGRPVRMVMAQPEVFRATGPTPGVVIRVKMGATHEGRITAAQAEMYYEAGAFPGSSLGIAAAMIFAAYDIPHGKIDGYDVVVNKPKSGSYRAPGVTQACFACESVIDELANKLDKDPIGFRALNCAREGTRLFHGSVHSDIGAREVLEAARDHDHYRAPLDGPNRGRGVAFAYWGNWGARSSCAINVNEDGTVSLVMGSVDITGTRTSVAMQAADVLGLTPEQIAPRVGDTDSAAFSQISAGSRTTVATGTAAVVAARDVIAQMCERAAILWSVPVETISYDRVAFTTAEDPGKRMTFAELASELWQTGGPITGVGNVDVQEWGGAFGAHVVDVEVDPETGKVSILRYTAVQDAGKAIHPLQVEGQMQGGAAQGIGWALYEGYAYDRDGRMLNPSFLDYKLPTPLDVPPIDTVIVEVPYPGHPYGARGVGEMPIIPPPAAIANAIYRASGARLAQLPMTPARILESTGVI